MAKGDFAKYIQPKIKNDNCDSCGSKSWSLVEELHGDIPRIVALPADGGMKMPPPSMETVRVVCNNCYFVRTYALPAA